MTIAISVATLLNTSAYEDRCLLIIANRTGVAIDFLFHRPFARMPTTMHPDILDADDTLSAKCPAQLAGETIGPLFVGFTICAAYV